MAIQFHRVELDGLILGAILPIADAPDRLHELSEGGIVLHMSELKASFAGKLAK